MCSVTDLESIVAVHGSLIIQGVGSTPQLGGHNSLYGEKLHFYGVIVKAGGARAPLPPGSVAYVSMGAFDQLTKEPVPTCMHTAKTAEV